jgi:hypothetical protein
MVVELPKLDKELEVFSADLKNIFNAQSPLPQEKPWE